MGKGGFEGTTNIQKIIFLSNKKVVNEYFFFKNEKISEKLL